MSLKRWRFLVFVLAVTSFSAQAKPVRSIVTLCQNLIGKIFSPKAPPVSSENSVFSRMSDDSFIRYRTQSDFPYAKVIAQQPGNIMTLRYFNFETLQVMQVNVPTFAISDPVINDRNLSIQFAEIEALIRALDAKPLIREGAHVYIVIPKGARRIVNWEGLGPFFVHIEKLDVLNKKIVFVSAGGIQTVPLSLRLINEIEFYENKNDANNRIDFLNNKSSELRSDFFYLEPEERIAILSHRHDIVENWGAELNVDWYLERLLGQEGPGLLSEVILLQNSNLSEDDKKAAVKVEFSRIMNALAERPRPKSKEFEMALRRFLIACFKMRR